MVARGTQKLAVGYIVRTSFDNGDLMVSMKATGRKICATVGIRATTILDLKQRLSICKSEPSSDFGVSSIAPAGAQDKRHWIFRIQLPISRVDGLAVFRFSYCILANVPVAVGVVVLPFRFANSFGESIFVCLLPRTDLILVSIRPLLSVNSATRQAWK
jgi:hypothetical protein